MATLQLTRGLSLDALCPGEQLPGCTLINFAPGWDGKLYLLYGQPTARGVPASHYAAVVATVDWSDGLRLLEQRVCLLEVPALAPFFLQPLDGGLLLVAARCTRYRDGRTDQNAMLFSYEGAPLRQFCVGDGIASCMTTEDDRIVTSYYDEGVFGNYGWDDPIGSCGLIKWDAQGVLLWKNERFPICDCYALNLDPAGWIWYYYYTDFNLVGTDTAHDLILTPRISGASNFAFNLTGNRLLFTGGYRESQFYQFRLRWNRLLLREKLSILADGQPLIPTRCSFYAHRLLFLRADNQLFGCEYK